MEGGLFVQFGESGDIRPVLHQHPQDHLVLVRIVEKILRDHGGVVERCLSLVVLLVHIVVADSYETLDELKQLLNDSKVAVPGRLVQAGLPLLVGKLCITSVL